MDKEKIERLRELRAKEWEIYFNDAEELTEEEDEEYRQLYREELKEKNMYKEEKHYLAELKEHIQFLKSEIEAFEEECYEMELYRKEHTTEYEEVKSNIIIYESELEEKEELLEATLLKLGEVLND